MMLRLSRREVLLLSLSSFLPLVVIILLSDHRLLLDVFVGVVEAKSYSYCNQRGWHQVWSDEFNGHELDESIWTKDIGDNHDSRTRQAKATADSVYLQEGNLVIRSNGTWHPGEKKWYNLTSGAIESRGKKSWKGPTRVCIRAKLPGGPPPGTTSAARARMAAAVAKNPKNGSGVGIWPAHWLMPDDDTCWPCHGEIDIMEMINGDGRVYGTYHWCLNQTCGDDKHSTAGSIKFPNDYSWSTKYHEFAVQYGTDGTDGKALLKFAIDGYVYHKVKIKQHLFSPIVFPDVPYYAILNTAIGGPWADPPNINNKNLDYSNPQFFTDHIVGPLEHTQFPTYHYIDWIRVAQPREHLPCWNKQRGPVKC